MCENTNDRKEQFWIGQLHMTTIHYQIYLLAVFNELSNDNISDWPKLKAVTDEKSKREKKNFPCYNRNH